MQNFTVSESVKCYKIQGTLNETTGHVCDYVAKQPSAILDTKQSFCQIRN